MTDLLTPAQARKEYNLGRDFVRALIRARKIPFIPVGLRKVLLPRDGIEAFLRRKTVPAKRQYFCSHRKSSALHTVQDKGVAGVGQSNYEL